LAAYLRILRAGARGFELTDARTGARGLELTDARPSNHLSRIRIATSRALCLFVCQSAIAMSAESNAAIADSRNTGVNAT
jgi:hypothetical protein